MTRTVRAVITDEPLDAAAICAATRDELCGAVASFVGVVRNHDGGAGVESIDYSAHPLAEETLRVIAESLAEVRADAVDVPLVLPELTTEDGELVLRTPLPAPGGRGPR